MPRQPNTPKATGVGQSSLNAAVEAEVPEVVVATDGAEGLKNSSSLAESSNVGLKRGAEEGISILKFN